MAVSVPAAPIAMPIVAAAMAGASFRGVGAYRVADRNDTEYHASAIGVRLVADDPMRPPATLSARSFGHSPEREAR